MSYLRSSDGQSSDNRDAKKMGESPPVKSKQYKSNYQLWQPYLKVSSITQEIIPSFKLVKFKRRPYSIQLLQRVIVKKKQIHPIFFKNMFIGRLFEKDERLRAIYETKELTLMNFGEHYNNIWDADASNRNRSKYTNNQARKKAIYILELSYPIEKPFEKISVESILYSVPKLVKKGRFVIAWDKKKWRPKQIFETETSSQLTPFMRQSSEQSEHQYYCSCREIISREDIGMIFIVYPKTMALNLPERLSEDLYLKLTSLSEILIFRHTALTKNMLKR